MKLLISPTVWLRFMRHTNLVPSASLTCMLVVGCDWSTSKRAVNEFLSTVGAEGPEAVRTVPLTGNVPGMLAELLALATWSPGTGDPRRWPEPAKARYLGAA